MIDCLVYFAVFAILYILNSLAARTYGRKISKLYVGISFVFLLVFIGFRFNVGTDYNSYLDEYNNISNMPWEQLPSLRTELFVAALFKVCSYILWDPKLIFLVLGFLMLWPIYRVNKLYDYKYLAYSVFVFCILFLPFGLNGMRQGVAMSYMLLSFVYFMRGDIKKGFMNSIVSVLFHNSALVALPHALAIYFCKRKKWNFTKINIVITTVIATVVLFFLNNLLLENGITKYSYMLGNISAENISLNSLMIYAPVAVLILCFRGNKQDEDLVVLRNIAITGLIFYLLGTSAHYLSRFSLYFMMSMILLIPKLIQNISQKKTRVFFKILVVIYLMSFFYHQYCANGIHEILPYQTWLFGGYV